MQEQIEKPLKANTYIHVHVLEQERKPHLKILLSFLCMGDECGFVDDFKITALQAYLHAKMGASWHV